MSLTFEQKLKRYADLSIKVGVNLREGQRLLLSAPIECTNITRQVTISAYQAGASFVDVLWDDDILKRIRFQHAPHDSFELFPSWVIDRTLRAIERGDSLLSIYAPDPDVLQGLDTDLIAIAQRTAQTHNSAIAKHLMSNATSWNAISSPKKNWAAKVFPDTPHDKQVEKLWDTIFTICRVDRDDPVQAWRNHIKKLQSVTKRFTAKQYTTLKYLGPNINMTVGLVPGHIWTGGSVISKANREYLPNIPTEEVFTTPHMDKAEGTLTSSKPLLYSGQIIDDFSMTFENGHVINFSAKKGEETLKNLIETDDGSKRLGEVALVPHSSPISQSGLLFYNTLYDENAASHFALGRAYPFCLDGGPEMSRDELLNVGSNYSLAHVDFMIGSGEMDVDGITADGVTEPIMRAGEWAF